MTRWGNPSTSPLIEDHSYPSPRNRASSHALASFQSRMTDSGEISRASAVSSTGSIDPQA